MKKAFTLIELLVVIVLMAIIAAISMPAFIGMGRGAGMRGETANIRAKLSLCRQWAITHREKVTIRYGEFFYGLHMGENGTTLLDAEGNFPVDEKTHKGLMVGRDIYNVTTGNHGTISANTATTIDAGGLLWSKYDRYRFDEHSISKSAYCVTGEEQFYIQKPEALVADVVLQNNLGSDEFCDSLTFTPTGGLTPEVEKNIIIADRKNPKNIKTITVNKLTGGLTVR
jgi:prepilin-type N-terminal cleavage/methylation domain-containing protein